MAVKHVVVTVYRRGGMPTCAYFLEKFLCANRVHSDVFPEVPSPSSTIFKVFSLSSLSESDMLSDAVSKNEAL